MLLEKMSASEYRDWQLYLASGTVLERLIDIHLARLTATITNIFRRKHSAARQLKEFLLLPPVPKAPLTPEQWLEKVKALNAQFGGEFIDKRDRKD
jgi:hypothetical protein